ncbi:MAG: hypothetical protein GOV15_00150 [Candidatus Diapherotrites archaeon]|nr:hypothetical protein [Candidatus Diapherotrites archaeon]
MPGKAWEEFHLHRIQEAGTREIGAGLKGIKARKEKQKDLYHALLQAEHSKPIAEITWNTFGFRKRKIKGMLKKLKKYYKETAETHQGYHILEIAHDTTGKQDPVVTRSIATHVPPETKYTDYLFNFIENHQGEAKASTPLGSYQKSQYHYVIIPYSKEDLAKEDALKKLEEVPAETLQEMAEDKGLTRTSNKAETIQILAALLTEIGAAPEENTRADLIAAHVLPVFLKQVKHSFHEEEE